MRFLIGAAACAVAGCALISGASSLTIDDGTGGSVADAGDGSSAEAGDGGDIVVPDGSAPSETTLFFLQASKLPDGGLVSSPGIVSLSTGTSRTIGCASAGAATQFGRTPRVGGSGDVNGPFRFGNLAMRSGSAFVYLDFTPTRLLAAGPTSDCASAPPLRIDRRDPQTENLHHLLPRFSPDGKRVAYFDVEPTMGVVRQLVTVGADGSDPRVLRRATDVGSEGGIWTAPPAWIANDELVWLESTGGTFFQPLLLRRMKDAAGATIVPVSSCSQYIEQLEVIPGAAGSIRLVTVSAPSSWSQGSGTSSNIGVYDLAASCTTASKITNDTAAGSASRDVAVSPDGSLIAFATNRDTPANQRKLDAPMHIWIAKTDGTSPPVRCSGQDASLDELGPQWVANGTKLAFMRSPRSVDQESIYLADVASGACSNIRPLLTDATDAGTRYLSSANASVSCNVGPTRGPAPWSSTVFGLSALALAATLRRRSSEPERRSATTLGARSHD